MKTTPVPSSVSSLEPEASIASPGCCFLPGNQSTGVAHSAPVRFKAAAATGCLASDNNQQQEAAGRDDQQRSDGNHGYHDIGRRHHRQLTAISSRPEAAAPTLGAAGASGGLSAGSSVLHGAQSTGTGTPIAATGVSSGIVVDGEITSAVISQQPADDN